MLDNLMMTADPMKPVFPTEKLMNETDIITVSGPNPPLKDLPVTSAEIKVAFLTLSNIIDFEQQL